MKKEKINIEFNEKITASRVLLIAEDGKSLGEMSKQVALQYARDINRDVVAVGKSNPQVVKICEKGKYLYNLSKSEKEKKKNQHEIKLKKIGVRINTGDRDIQIKINSATRFLKEGNKVQFIMKLRRPERIRTTEGMELMLKKIAEPLSPISDIEQKPSTEGNSVTMTLFPCKKS